MNEEMNLEVVGENTEMELEKEQAGAVEIKTDQGSDEWLELREGVITASKIVTCFTGKGAISKAGIKTLAKNLIAEIYKVDEPNISTWAMERGHSLEVEARDLMGLKIGQPIRQAGFFINKDKNIGASPDGIIEKENGFIGLEIKCPLAKKHIDTLIDNDDLDMNYYAQVQFSMYVTGVSEWYFCSYYPNLRPLIKVIPKDEIFHEKITEVIGLINESIAQFQEIINS